MVELNPEFLAGGELERLRLARYRRVLHVRSAIRAWLHVCTHAFFFFLLSSFFFSFPFSSSFFESGFDTQFNMSTQLHRHPHAPVSSPVSSLTIRTRLARASRRGLVIPTAVSENSNRSRSTTVHKLVDYFGAITIPGRLE
jgi:hypothetical protein